MRSCNVLSLAATNESDVFDSLGGRPDYAWSELVRICQKGQITLGELVRKYQNSDLAVRVFV